MDRSSCGGFLWSTGEDLRNSPDAALAHRLSQTGALLSTACKARACGKTGPATRRRSRAISSATLTNPLMTRRGGRSATSRSKRACAPPARAGVLAPPAPRPPFCRSSPAHRVCRPRLLARRLQNPQVRRRQPRQESRPARRLRPKPARPIRCAASALALASRAARDPTFRSAANAASSASSQPAAPARIQAARWERRRSDRAISAATAVKSIPAPAACRHAAPARSSMANVRQRSRTVRRRIVDRGLPCLRRRLCGGRRLLLPRKQGDLDRRLLPRRRGAGARPKDVRADLPHSGRPAVLRVQPYPDRERRLLLARERDHERRMLLQADRLGRSVGVPEVDRSHQAMRRRLYLDGGRNMLQQPKCQPRWTRMHRRLATVRARRDPRPQRRLRPDPGRADPAARDQRARVPARRGADP